MNEIKILFWERKKDEKIFVEIENNQGESIDIGEWEKDGNYKALRIDKSCFEPNDLSEEMTNIINQSSLSYEEGRELIDSALMVFETVKHLDAEPEEISKVIELMLLKKFREVK